MAGVELPLLGHRVGLMARELAPPSPALPATDLLASLSLGENKTLTQPERQKARGMRPAGISCVPILSAAPRGSDGAPRPKSSAAGMDPSPPTGQRTPGSCPSVSPRAQGMAQKPGGAENWRANLKSEVPGGASSAFPVASITPKVPCPACGHPPAQRTGRCQGQPQPRGWAPLQEGEENKTKQAWE